MKRKKFNVFEFPKFVASRWEEHQKISILEYMKKLGYKSAIQKDRYLWSLSVEEYTWFVLRWS